MKGKRVSTNASQSVFSVFGIRIAFLNLCDQQTTVHGVGPSDLPGELPAGASFVIGLDVHVLNNGEVIETLPSDTGIQMDFPVGATDGYAVLFGSKAAGEWIELSAPLNADGVSEALGNGAGDGLYQLSDDDADLFFEVLTTKMGTFVLIQK